MLEFNVSVWQLIGFSILVIHIYNFFTKKMANNEDNVRIESYRVPKIPPFAKSDPAFWFQQVEASFRTARITTQVTMADTVIGALDFEIAYAARDLIFQEPRDDNIYDKIKQRIISSFAASPEANLRKLLKGEIINDCKPSLLLTKLRALNNGSCSDSVLRSIFLDLLPDNMRPYIATTDEKDLNKLACQADRMFDYASNFSAINSVANIAPIANNGNTELLRSIQEITKRLDRIETSNHNRSRSRSRNRNNRNFNNKNRNGQNYNPNQSHYHNKNNKDGQKLCLAHTKYPDNPLTCRSWCSKFNTWKSKNE